MACTTPSVCQTVRNLTPFTSKPTQQLKHTGPSSLLPGKQPLRTGVTTTRRVVLTTASSQSAEVVVVGGGVAGLTAAGILSKAKINCLLVESSDAIGGRVRTDAVDGFLLDRGFQIFLTSYPEARALLDYNALELKPFYAGALVYYSGEFHRVADPFRHFVDGISGLTNPIGTPADKVNVGVYRMKSLLGSLDDVLSRDEVTTYQKLKDEGFSEEIIDRFFRPFLGGIFFNRDLTVSSRLLQFVMRMLATGSNCLPAKGIGAVSSQLGARLPPGSILTGKCVTKVRAPSNGKPGFVTLENGDVLEASKGVVVATDGPAAKQILGDLLGGDLASKSEAGVGTCCLYYRAPRAPDYGNILYLNGEGSGIVNNACFPSTVASSYAPDGQTLVSVSTVGTLDECSDAELFDMVKAELGKWFGQTEVDDWTPLKLYRIPFAQPNQVPPTNLQRPVRISKGLYVCGDHRDSATLDGALKSGRRAAEALLSDAGLL